MTIEVKHKLPVTVDTVQVTLPFFYKCGKYAPHYCCMQPDGNLVQVYSQGGYWHIEVTPHDDADEISVFHHKFSESHREVFYMVNPQLRPKL